MLLRNILGTSSFRQAVMYAVLTGVCFLLLFAVIFWSTSRFMRHQIDDSVSDEIGEIVGDPATASGRQRLHARRPASCAAAAGHSESAARGRAVDVTGR